MLRGVGLTAEICSEWWNARKRKNDLRPRKVVCEECLRAKKGFEAKRICL